jgi:hypothetical protein
MDRLKGVGLLAIATVACPCNLPILLAVLGGTTVGAVLTANLLPVVVLLGTVSIGALIVAFPALEAGSKRARAPQDLRRQR